MKFGGTSVGSAENIKKVIGIAIKSKNAGESPVLVVSAFSGVTDELIKLASLSALGKDYKDGVAGLEKRHLDAVRELLAIKAQNSVLANVKILLNELEDALRGVSLLKEASPRTLDFIMSFGERLSAYIISEVIKNRGILSECLDARGVLKTDDNFGNAKVAIEESYENIRKYFDSQKTLAVVTGFIASTKNNETTTLGRGGSDYTASLFGAALGAEIIEIWTDVDGVLTADPKKVQNALSIDQMTYEEAMEMSYFGAKVIHPPTMQPALEAGIPLIIKNTFNPTRPGTLVGKEPSKNDFPVTGISSINDIALLRIQGSGLVGAKGVAGRLFGALAKSGVNIILITQASSEHSICLAVDAKDGQMAKNSLAEELAMEITTGRVEEPTVEHDLSIIAVVGQKMKNRPGIAGRLFQTLGRNGINSIAIAQGSSELNISVVINKNNLERALNVVHQAFFGKTASLNIFLVGTGNIGGELLKQISEQKETLKNQGLTLNVIALADAKKMMLNEAGISPECWQNILETNGEEMNLQKFIEKIKTIHLPNSVFVDCTASDAPVAFYEALLKSGISIVTPNKKANSGPLDYYKKIRAASLSSGAKFLYETNVGAGLPIINTLNDLLATGDRVIKIEAVLSGTLSYIFNNFLDAQKFSEVVREAQRLGYTEPDPRDDLNGLDVARKLVILGREIGLDLEISDVKIEALIDEECKQARAGEDFFKKLEKMDQIFEVKKQTARAEKKRPRFIALLQDGRANVSLRSVDEQHPFYSLSGSDNIVSFTTERYKNTPLVVRGPGAGAAVTAAGVFADILHTMT